MREFQTNDEHMRDLVYEYWNDLKQDDDEKFRDYVVRTRDLAKEVNEKFKLAGVSTEKVTADDIKLTRMMVTSRRIFITCNS